MMNFNSAKDEEEFIEVINYMLEAAVKDGGDAGGPYHQAIGELTEKIENMLFTVGLNSKYSVTFKPDSSHWNYCVIERR